MIREVLGCAGVDASSARMSAALEALIEELDLDLDPDELDDVEELDLAEKGLEQVPECIFELTTCTTLALESEWTIPFFFFFNIHMFGAWLDFFLNFFFFFSWSISAPLPLPLHASPHRALQHACARVISVSHGRTI